jgi:hypothetical protein
LCTNYYSTLLGPWADTSAEWKPYKDPSGKTIPELKYSLVDDGSFFLRYDDFLAEFDVVESCDYPVAAGKYLLKMTFASQQNIMQKRVTRC